MCVYINVNVCVYMNVCTVGNEQMSRGTLALRRKVLNSNLLLLMPHGTDMEQKAFLCRLFIHFCSLYILFLFSSTFRFSFFRKASILSFSPFFFSLSPFILSLSPFCLPHFCSLCVFYTLFHSSSVRVTLDPERRARQEYTRYI